MPGKRLVVRDLSQVVQRQPPRQPRQIAVSNPRASLIEPNGIEVRDKANSFGDVALRRAEEDEYCLPTLTSIHESRARVDPALPFAEVAETTRSDTLVQFA